MDITSSQKVLAAGFRVIRRADYPSIRIVERSGSNGGWKSLEDNFPSKAARDRRCKELLKDPMTIED